MRDAPSAQYAHARLTQLLTAKGDAASELLDRYIREHPDDAWQARVAKELILGEPMDDDDRREEIPDDLKME